MIARIGIRLSALAAAALVGACSLFGPPPPPDPHPQVLMQTSLGDITVELDRDRAPQSVDNFLQYVKDKHYNGTVFHRVIPGFVAQGGGYDTSFKERPTRKPIPLESSNGLSNLRGTLAMAREEAPDTATSQFYFNLVDNAYRLDPHPENPQRRYGYAVFGKIITGLAVIDQMAAQPTSTSPVLGQPDVPVQNIVLIKAKLLPRTP
jgi:cyclophilin family peptidyl-prolyl cis-trans isomerase